MIPSVTFGKVYRGTDRQVAEFAELKNLSGIPAEIGFIPQPEGLPVAPERAVFTNEGDKALDLHQSVTKRLNDVWQGKGSLTGPEKAQLEKDMVLLSELVLKAKWIA